MITGRLLGSRARRWAVLAVVAVLSGGMLLMAWRPAAPAPVDVEPVQIAVAAGPGVTGDILLDSALYLPAVRPAPAVLLAHGFGGSRLSVAADAERLARAGFVVLAYSARGFGASGGMIGLDSLDYEVADARALVGWLTDRPEVLQDSPGDPRIGVTGGSYGGALALMVAGTDPRVDAVTAVATWNDLGTALFPNNLGAADAPTPAAIDSAPDGVFKASWTAALMSSVIASGLSGPEAPPPDDALCGRLMPELCAAYTEVARTGRSTPAMDRLLARSSPAAVAGSITAPTLLIQGTSDTLFGLDQADANARAIAADGTPVAVTWYAGGHSGGPPDDATAQRVDDWFGYYLAGTGTEPSTAFRYTVPGPVSERGRPRLRTLELPDYPGLTGPPAAHHAVTMTGGAQLLLNPPGGQPAAITSLPGLPATLSSLASLGSLPGQTATFVSEPLDDALVVTGSIPVTLSIGRFGPPGDTVVYLSVAAVDGDGLAGQASVGGAEADGDDETAGDGAMSSGAGGLSVAGGGPAGGAVAAVRVPDLPGDGTAREVTVQLPAVAFQVGAGKRLAIRVATTDQAFAGERIPALYTVSLAQPIVQVPTVGGIRTGGEGEPVGLAIGLGALVLAAIIGLAVAGRVRRPATPPPPAGDIRPLTITGLAKQYPGPVHAVRDVSLTVERGQVLGLLGPNGAGKTTTLRMVMGLITPSSGEIAIFGEPAGPGAPVLSRIGSFVEGAGFLPHLSGAANLDLYWRATGRPRDAAHQAEALEIAGLGGAVDRRVKTYSQGMRQRLAIAQAMLGLPDLLILDEPTNGLDPPQIHAMREVLRRYADTGRTVVVSSHLLSEVEQTCTHVVVMAQGRTIASGTVAELVAASGQFTIGTPEPDAGAAQLAKVEGLGAVTPVAGGLSVDLGPVDLATVLRALLDAGVPVTSAAPRHRLEDVFLELVEEDAP